ncbi:membrane primary amine oxidase-like [Mya arenaria]|nr:membrane primary amine oxidase-like [Mya arenaria]
MSDEEEVPLVSFGEDTYNEDEETLNNNSRTLRLKDRSTSVRRVSLNTCVIGCVSSFVIGLVAGFAIYYFMTRAHDNNLSCCALCGGEEGLKFNKNSSPFPYVKSSSPEVTIPVSTETVVQTNNSVRLFTSTESPQGNETELATCAPCPSISSNSTEELQTFKSCPTRNPYKKSPIGQRKSPFTPLDPWEVRKVTEIMKGRKYVTIYQRFNEHRISHMYLIPPRKDDVLAYYDSDGPLPPRFAKVHVIRPNISDIMYYKVGPLDQHINGVQVEEMLSTGHIHINIRPYDYEEDQQLQKLLHPQVLQLSQILHDSFDGATYPKDIRATFEQLPTSSVNERLSHMNLVLNGEGYFTLRLLPISCTVSHPGIDVTNWEIKDWVYLSQGPYNSTNELLNSFERNQIRKVVFPKDYRQQHADELNLKRDMSLPERAFSNVPPPRTYEPQGARYSIDINRVEWMGWSFEFTSDPIRGPALFNIRFLDQRIAYEISLQDITLLYHPDTNGHGPLALADTVFHLGSSYVHQRTGLDCPSRGTLLNVSSTSDGFAIRTPFQAACVFEADGQRALWRHAKGGLADHFLVVRTVLMLGNYDYVVEWNFRLDGSLDTLLTASGYLFGAFWDNGSLNETKTPPFGFKLGDYMSGPIHDHTYSFKVDLDIIGSKNSFQKLKWKTGDVHDILNISKEHDFHYFNITRYIEYELLETETSLKWNSQKPQYWTVINEEIQNAWGAPRGYRLIPHSREAEVLKDHPILAAWDHLGYQVAVSRRKEDEQYATNTYYTTLAPNAPPKGVGQMVLDGEAIGNEDIVVWVSEKFYHIPSAEDVPVTIGATAGFTLKPFNFFDRTPTFDLPAHYQGTNDPYEFRPCVEHLGDET